MNSAVDGGPGDTDVKLIFLYSFPIPNPPPKTPFPNFPKQKISIHEINN